VGVCNFQDEKEKLQKLNLSDMKKKIETKKIT